LKDAADAQGTVIAHFRLGDELGRGGMGVVYRAVDRRLHRSVALKVLPPALTGDARRRSRVLREARAAAAVAHPAIATVYEVGEYEGAIYIAMELVEGVTLLERVQRDGPFATVEALRVAIEVAGALQHAHQSGVVHRDLKDDNVMITPSGSIKLVDFGLARIHGGGDPDVIAEADTEVPSSRADIAAGTPGFMAPEQTKNQGVDHRADIFSFGALLVRMVTGELPFRGGTAFELAIAPMHDEPSLEGVPEELVPIITRCLERSPDDRYSTAAELSADMQRALTTLTATAPLADPPAEPSRRVPAALAGLGVVVGLGLAAASFRDDPAEPGLAAPSATATVGRAATQATNLTLKQVTNESAADGVPRGALSPDGARVAFAHSGGLFVREVATGEQRLVVDEPGLQPLAWRGDAVICATSSPSPALVTQPLAGGPHQPLYAPAFMAAVSPDETRVAVAASDGVRILSADGGDVLALPLPRVEAQDLGLQWHPSGDRLLLLRPRRDEHGGSVRVESMAIDGLKASAPTLAFDDRSLAGQTAYGAAVWLADGRLVVAVTEPPPDNLTSNLWETVVDPKTGEASGPLRRLTRWPDAGLWYMTADRAGERVLLSLLKSSISLMTAPVAASGALAAPPTPLPSDASIHWPSGWLDDERLLYTSNRNGRLDVFAHRLGRSDFDPVLATSEHDTYAVAIADGWLHYRVGWNDADNGMQSALMKSSKDGATAERLASAPLETARFTFGSASPVHAGVRCTHEGKRCVIGDKRDGRFGVRDLASGKRLRARAPEQGGLVSWDLSPDGAAVAIMEGRLDQATTRVLIFTSDPDKPEIVELDRSCSPTGMDWVSADRAYVSCFDLNGSVLLSVELDGGTRELHRAPPHTEIWQPFASPSGRHVVYRQDVVTSSLWLVEGW
jgi:Protein kinase domain